ncbi:hypothetical protein HAX54_028739 [Datura stramonium]|uniref:Uncharacterized protein n=1 Tax=Datura stramonium TaxID=4076 RepID=A0ABS8V4M2_DATST|nr:hypothetical protein [Datura stramonium]
MDRDADKRLPEKELTVKRGLGQPYPNTVGKLGAVLRNPRGEAKPAYCPGEKGRLASGGAHGPRAMFELRARDTWYQSGAGLFHSVHALAWRKVVVSRGILASRGVELARGEHCRMILETFLGLRVVFGVVLWAPRARGHTLARWPRVGQLGRVAVYEAYQNWVRGGCHAPDEWGTSYGGQWRVDG